MKISGRFVALTAVVLGAVIILGVMSTMAQNEGSQTADGVWPDRYRIIVVTAPVENQSSDVRPILLDTGTGDTWFLEKRSEWRKLPRTEKLASGG